MKVKDASELRRVDGGRTAEPKRQEAHPAAADKVSTEDRQRLDAAIATARAAVGGSRAVRLETIEAAVRQGLFKPDPQRIAQKIMDDAELTAVLQMLLKR